LVVSSNGNLEITLSGPSGGSWAVSGIDIVRSSNQANPDFELAVVPTGGTVALGGIIQMKVVVNSVNGFDGTVAVDLRDIPTGATATPSQFTASVLPTTKTISLKVAPPVAIGTYTLQAMGSDTAGSSVHLADYKLTVLAAGSVIAEPTTITPDTNTPSVSAGTVIVAPEIKPDFKKIDTFVATQEQNAAGKFDLGALSSLSNTLSAVDIIPGFEPPKTTVGVVLQLMVQSGIINAAVSNGPPNGPFPTPKPQNWFQKAIGGIFAPAS
jgi:hypothetical protein